MLAAHCDPVLRQCRVPISDPRVWEKAGFIEMNGYGWASFTVKVMGWWAFDVFTLLTGSLAPADTSAQTIMRNVGLYTFMIPVGLGGAVNFYVGKYIGKARIELAKRMFKYGQTIAYGWSFASMASVFFFK